MRLHLVMALLVGGACALKHRATISSTLDATGHQHEEADAAQDVLQRMRYWEEGRGSAVPQNAVFEEKSGMKNRRYLLFDIDVLGINNKRIAWEMAGLIAQYSKRTLVL